MSFDTELNDLRQIQNEFIIIYYKRLIAFMLRIEARDRIDTESFLSLLKSATSNVIMKSFVRDLLNDDIRKKTIRELIMTNRFLRELCNLTEDVDRAKKKFHKFMKEKNKIKKLTFYKEMISRSISQDKVQVMLIFYKIDVISIDWIMKRSFDKSAQFSRMLLENINDNTRYFESEEDYVLFRSQTSEFDQENSTRSNSDSHNSSNNQESQNSDRRSNSASLDRRSEFHKSSSRELFSTFTSLNEFVNESKKWLSEDDSLCVKCDELDHMIRDCNDRMLSVWEQFYFRSLIFENTFQFNFCSIDFDAYDDSVNSYETIKKNSELFLNAAMSIIYELFENEEIAISVETVSLNVMYEKKFESNKRSHHEQIMSDSTRLTFVSIERVIKKKSQKRIEKKSESQSLMSMFDDVLDAYE